MIKCKHRLSLGRETLDSIEGIVIYPLSTGLSQLANRVEQECTRLLIGIDSLVVLERDIARLVSQEHYSVDNAKRQSALETLLDNCCSDMGINNQFQIEEV